MKAPDEGAYAFDDRRPAKTANRHKQGYWGGESEETETSTPQANNEKTQTDRRQNPQETKRKIESQEVA